MESIKSLCRGCLSTEADISLDDIHKNCFLDIAGICINREDMLPKVICEHCSIKFDQFLQFRDLLKQTNVFLLQEFQKRNPQKHTPIPCEIKEENVDDSKEDFVENDSDSKSEELIFRKKIKSMKKVKKMKKKLKEIPKKKSRYFLDLDPNKISIKRISKEEQIRNFVMESKNEIFLSMPFKCMQCYKGFNYERKLQTHAENYHKINSQYTCLICTRTLRNAASLSLHKQRHDTAYVCVACTRSFSDKKIAVAHYSESHEGTTIQLPCRECGKVFRHRSSLNSHMRSYHIKTEKPACDFCMKTFSSKDSLADHLLIHTGEKNYSCNQCNKRFRTKSEVKVHKRSHSNVRPFYCVQCDRAFKTSHSYKCHLTTVKAHTNSDTRTYECSQCLRVFSSKSGLRAHSHRHGDAVTCQTCGLQLPSRASYTRHHRTVHLKLEPPKNFICHTCGKRFSVRMGLEKHINTHTGARPYQCGECGAAFTQKATLNTHAKRLHSINNTVGVS